MNFLWVDVAWCELLWVDVGRCELFMGGCELVWTFYGLVWVGVGGCNLFMGWCGLVWTFMGRCGSVWTFMGRYGSVWVGVNFLWVGVGWCGSVWVGAQSDITEKNCVLPKFYSIQYKKWLLLIFLHMFPLGNLSYTSYDGNLNTNGNLHATLRMILRN